MSNSMNDQELKEFGELARQLIEVEGTKYVNCGWFNVTYMGENEDLVWIHKFGATIFLYGNTTSALNKAYVAEAWCAYRYLQKRLVLDRIARNA